MISNALVQGAVGTITISENGTTGFVSLKINGVDIPKNGTIDVQIGSYVVVEFTIDVYYIKSATGVQIPTENGRPSGVSTFAPPMGTTCYFVAPNEDVYFTGTP